MPEENICFLSVVRPYSSSYRCFHSWIAAIRPSALIYVNETNTNVEVVCVCVCLREWWGWGYRARGDS